MRQPFLVGLATTLAVIGLAALVASRGSERAERRAPRLRVPMSTPVATRIASKPPPHGAPDRDGLRHVHAGGRPRDAGPGFRAFEEPGDTAVRETFADGLDRWLVAAG